MELRGLNRPLSLITMSFSDSADALFKGINKVFGTPATYTYVSDSSTSEVKGVFENAFVEVNGVSDLKPVFKNLILDTLDFEPEEGDTIEINDVTYKVESHQPDGLGSTTLILNRVN
jgi:hypothetical protein